MSRLPEPGKDIGTWGIVLNDYLCQSHNADGSIRDNVVNSTSLIGNISQTKISNLKTDLENKANTADLSAVALSGSYDDLIGKPNIPSSVSDALRLDQTIPQKVMNGQPIQDSLTASQLVATDADKKMQSLPVSTYPSLIELSYVKGLTGSAQTQLTDKTSIGLTCRELKMTADDPTKGIDNYLKLVTAINSGNKILVDNNYYLECLTTVPFTKNVIIQGVNGNAKLTLKEGCSFFDVNVDCGAIIMSGIKFVNSGTRACLLFVITGVLYIEYINIAKNSFEGNISLMRYSPPITLDPSVVKYGLGSFVFEDNTVNNTRLSFLSFDSVPCEVYQIRRNLVRNFDYRFFSAGTANDHSFLDELFDSQQLLIVTDNDVRCDDSWFGAGSNGSYYLFILFEGLEARYANNHVEGIKSDYIIAIYDVYLSSKIVEYCNNTWKNNICFNAGKLNNTLMKAKSGTGIRNFRNNNFIIEESFATRLGKDSMLLRVTMYDIVSPSERWEIFGNIFDVFYLNFHQSSTEAAEIWIENNTFKCQYVEDTLLNYRIDIGVDYTKNIHKIRNNVFKINGFISGLRPFRLVECSDYSLTTNKYGLVIIDNNTISVVNMSYVVYEVIADTLEIKNNTIEILSENPSVQGFIYSSSVNNYKNINNFVRKPNGRFLEGNFDYLGDVIENYVIQDNGTTNENSSISLSPINPITKKYRYIRQYEILCATGLLQFSFSFDYYYDADYSYNMITFTDSSYVVGSYKLSKPTDVASGEGSGSLLLLIGDAGIIKVRFNNSKNGNSIYLYDLPDGYKTIKVKTFCAIV